MHKILRSPPDKLSSPYQIPSQPIPLNHDRLQGGCIPSQLNLLRLQHIREPDQHPCKGSQLQLVLSQHPTTLQNKGFTNEILKKHSCFFIRIKINVNETFLSHKGQPASQYLIINHS